MRGSGGRHRFSEVVGLLGVASAIVLAACGSGSGTSSAPSTAGTVPTSSTTRPELAGAPPAVRLVDLPGLGVRWEVAASTSLRTADHVVADETTVVVFDAACVQPAVAGIDRSTGEVRWERGPAGGAVLLDVTRHRIGIADGLLVVPRELGTGHFGLAALEVGDGAERWTVDVPGLAALEAGGPVVVAVAVGESGSARLLGLDRGSGEAVWEQDVPEGLTVVGLVSDGRRVYASAYAREGTGNEVLAVPLDGGDVAWRRALSPGSDRSTVEVAGDVVVGTDEATGDLLALDAGTGDERWRLPGFSLPQQGEGSTGTASETSDLVVVLAAGGVGVVDPSSGALRWSRTAADLGAAEGVALVGASGAAVVLGADDALVGLDPGDGSLRWTVAHEELAALGPAGGLVPTEGGAFVLGPCGAG